MCARYTVAQSMTLLRERFGLKAADVEELPLRYNVAPSQKAPVIVLEKDGRVLRHHSWGLIPAWAKDPNVAHKLVNARSETVDEKPSFKASFKSKRCLVAADGFYEWKGKDPMRIVLPSREPFAMAGLWEEWEGRRTFTIVTTGPNELMKTIHARMPVILKREEEAAWLDPKSPPDELKALMRPYPEPLTAYRVPPGVNSTKGDDASYIEEVPEDPTLF